MRLKPLFRSSHRNLRIKFPSKDTSITGREDPAAPGSPGRKKSKKELRRIRRRKERMQQRP